MKSKPRPSLNSKNKQPVDHIYTSADALSFLSEEPELNSIVDVMKRFS